MKFTLPANGPIDVEATLSRYHIWGEDPVNRVEDGVFRRVLRLDGDLWPWEARWQGASAQRSTVEPGKAMRPTSDEPVRVDIDVPGARHTRVVDAVKAEAMRIFGLGFDLVDFYRFAKGDPLLADLIEPLHGLRPTLAPSGLEMLVGSITAQQVNLAFAFACRARLVRRYGTPVVVPRRTRSTPGARGEDAASALYAFPEAAALAEASVGELRDLKYSTRKAEYITAVARAIADGALDLSSLATATNAAVIERITGCRGLGVWTAEWYLARCLGRGDVCPAGDLGVRRAVEHYYAGGRALTEEAVRRRARAWGPYRNLATHYLLAGHRLGLPAGRRR